MHNLEFVIKRKAPLFLWNNFGGLPRYELYQKIEHLIINTNLHAYWCSVLVESDPFIHLSRNFYCQDIIEGFLYKGRGEKGTFVPCWHGVLAVQQCLACPVPGQSLQPGAASFFSSLKHNAPKGSSPGPSHLSAIFLTYSPVNGQSLLGIHSAAASFSVACGAIYKLDLLPPSRAFLPWKMTCAVRDTKT